MGRAVVIQSGTLYAGFEDAQPLKILGQDEKAANMKLRTFTLRFAGEDAALEPVFLEEYYQDKWNNFVSGNTYKDILINTI